MAGFSDYLENKILNHINGVAAYTAPTHVYLALSTTTPADDGTGVTEPTGGSYVRLECDNTTATWNTSVAGVFTNKVSLSWIQATGNWGTIVASAAYDDPSAGNMLWAGTPAQSRSISSGETYIIGVSNLSVALD